MQYPVFLPEQPARRLPSKPPHPTHTTTASHARTNPVARRVMSTAFTLVLLLTLNLLFSGTRVPLLGPTVSPGSFLFSVQLDATAVAQAAARTGRAPGLASRGASTAQEYRFHILAGHGTAVTGKSFRAIPNPAYSAAAGSPTLNLTTLLGVANELHSDTPANTLHTMSADLRYMDLLLVSAKCSMTGLILVSGAALALLPGPPSLSPCAATPLAPYTLHLGVGLLLAVLAAAQFVCLTRWVWFAVFFVTTYYWETKGVIQTSYWPLSAYCSVLAVSALCAAYAGYSLFAFGRVAWINRHEPRQVPHHKLL